MFIFNLGAYKKYVTKSKININKEPESLSLSENYYAETAFKLNAQKTFENEKIIVTDESSDLRMFGDCPYLLGAGTSAFWFSYIKKPKPHGYFINKKYIRWVKRKHKQLFKAEVGSTSGLFTIIKLACLCATWFLGGLFV